MGKTLLTDHTPAFMDGIPVSVDVLRPVPPKLAGTLATTVQVPLFIFGIPVKADELIPVPPIAVDKLAETFQTPLETSTIPEREALFIPVPPLVVLRYCSPVIEFVLFQKAAYPLAGEVAP